MLDIIKEIRNKKDYWAIISIAVILMVIYFGSLGAPFVFDDFHMILHNNLIKDASKFSLLFTSGTTTSVPIIKGMYRPFLMLSFAFNYFFGRLNPLGYHIINILFHFLNAVLIFALLRSLLTKNSFWPAFLATLIFVIHPLYSETVIYISCRSTLMTSFFFLVGTLAYINSDFKRYPDRYYFFSVGAFILGLLTKETMIVFPLALLAYDCLFRRYSKDILRISRPYLLFALIALSYLLLRQHLVGVITNIQPIRSLSSNIFTQLSVSIFYLKLFFYPLNLCVARVFPTSVSFFEPATLRSTLVVSILLLIALRSYRRLPLLSLAIFWYFINLIPKFIATLSLVATEHHLYLSSIGIILGLAIFMQRFIYILKERKLLVLKVLASLAFIILVGVLSLLAFKRNMVWKDEFSLWSNNLKCSPIGWGAYNNLGIAAVNAGRLEEGRRYYLEALQGSKKAPSAGIQVYLHLNLAQLYLVENKFDLAQKELMKTMALDPNIAEVHNNLGIVYAHKGLKEKEEEEFKIAIKLNPSFAGAYLNLGISYWTQGKRELALEICKKAIEVNPDYVQPYRAISIMYEKLGEFKQALDYRSKLLDLSDSAAEDYYDLGVLYGKLGSVNTIDAFKKAISLAPKFAAAHNNLAVAYANLEPAQIQLARKHALLALKYGYKVNPAILKQLGIEAETK